MNTTHKKNKIATAVSCAYITLALSPAYASDVEIYTQAISNASVSPVVMMMFDTSGSMEWCVNSGLKDCTSPNRRKDVLKESMNQVLNGSAPAPGYVKMGLSRYQSNDKSYKNSSGNWVDFDGGWVTYPARPLDAFVAINPDGDISSKGSTSGSDSSGTDTASTSLVVSSTNDVGLYFPNVMIPLGATITEAKITLVAKNNNPSVTSWQTAIDSRADVEPFNSVALTSSARNFVNATSAIEIPAWEAGTSYDVDVKELVQSVAKNNANWCGGNAMAFRLRDIDSESRTAYSWDGDQTKAAKLTVKFSISPTKTDSCIAFDTGTDNTSTFDLGGTSSNTVDLAQAKLDDVEWTEGLESIVTPSNGSLSINKITANKRNQVAVRLTTGAPIPPKATITSATLTITPSDSYPKSTTTNVTTTTYGCIRYRSNGTCRTYGDIVTVTPVTTQVNPPPKPMIIKMFNSRNLPKFCTSTTSCNTDAFSTGFVSQQALLNQSSFTANTAINIDTTTSSSITEMVRSLVSTTTGDITTVGFMLGNQSTTTADSATAAIWASESTNASAGSNPVKLVVKWKGVIRDLSKLTTVRSELWSAIQSLDFTSSTPLGAAYAEVSRYMYGLQPFYQNSKYDQPDSRTVNSTTADANQRYKKPIDATSQCSGNYIFLLTDGAPTIDASVALNAKGVTGKTACSVSAADEKALVATTGTTYDSMEELNWRCILDLANTNNKTSLHTADIVKDVKVPIKTSTVILGPEGGGSEIQMRRAAALGGGTYTKANDTAALVSAMTRTINSALDQSGILASPGVAINQFNRLNTLDQVYYVLFDPSSASKRWEGNLKRYQLDLATENIKDLNGKPAVGADGEFTKDSQSWWTTSADGSSSTIGGAASNLPAPESRKIYTYVDTSKADLDALSTTNVNTTTFMTKVKTAAYPTGSTNIPTDATFKNLINWFRGYDIDVYSTTTPVLATAPARQKLGGGLHSRATLVNYGYTGSTRADAVDPNKQDNVIFFSTLGSTLHGIKASTGEEIFAFIPGEKLSAIKTLYDNISAVEPEYGMDLTWTVYRKDKNGDGQIKPDIDSGDKLYMYGGMRMGGRNYYGLDLSKLTAPKSLFSIIGGTTGAYVNLGQTWSQPVLADIKVGTTVTKVLIFGGGYDYNCYENTTCATASQGNQLYIINAETGALIWWASSAGSPTLTVPAMTHSIPSQPKVIDLNSDGLADTIYIGDLGGQLFRADINNGQVAASLVKRVKLVAQLGSNGETTPENKDYRRIYEPPTVALFKDTTLNKTFAAVAVGTGNRSRPLNTVVSDRYSTIFDFDVTRADLLTVADTSLQPTALFSNMTAIDLTDNASTGTPTYAVDANEKKSLTKYGWYVDLISNGEKSLSSGIIFLNQLLFTTYSPETAQSGCSIVAGSTNLYEMCMPYGNQCDASTPRRTASLVMGLGGDPQLVIQPRPTGDGTGGGSTDNTNPDIGLGVLIKTKLDTKKTLGKKQYTPLHRWREKTRFPAQ
ncbi:MAG: PilC/PilY family type IV pilus protein [Agitococcus sp.]|nr:PilC/PilY family type IV pilus protein [Agitococcus sp.]